MALTYATTLSYASTLISLPTLFPRTKIDVTTTDTVGDGLFVVRGVANCRFFSLYAGVIRFMVEAGFRSGGLERAHICGFCYRDPVRCCGASTKRAGVLYSSH